MGEKGARRDDFGARCRQGMQGEEPELQGPRQRRVQSQELRRVGLWSMVRVLQRGRRRDLRTSWLRCRRRGDVSMLIEVLVIWITGGKFELVTANTKKKKGKEW